MPSRVMAFVGDDPGQKGAGCLLGVTDDPDGPQHGSVVYAAVWDHALRTTDAGEHVDPIAFAEQVRSHAMAAHVEPSTRMPIARVVIERPSIQGKAGKFAAGTIVTQCANYGVVLGASLCSANFNAALVEDAIASGGRWRAEAGVAAATGEDAKVTAIREASLRLKAWADAGATIVVPERKDGLTHDQADAALLAYLGVLRWLGRTTAPVNAGGAAKIKARAKAARDYEVERAVAGIDTKTLKTLARGVACPRCFAAIGEVCGKTLCRERTWAAAASYRALQVPLTRPDALRAHPGSAITCSRGVWRMGTDKISRAVLDAAIDSGLVRLTLDDKRRPVWVVR